MKTLHKHLLFEGSGACPCLSQLSILSQFASVFCGPEASCSAEQVPVWMVPVYDARCVLTGAAVVEILASPIKVPPVRDKS